MRKSLYTLLCGSALCVGMVASSVNASESRTVTFSVPCSGSDQLVNFTATGLGTASTRFIQGAEVALFQFPQGMQYLVLAAAPSSGPTDHDTLLLMGQKDSHVSRDYTGFYSIPNNAGSIAFTIHAACNSGDQMQGIVKVEFFS